MSAIPLSSDAFGSDVGGLGAFETPWSPPVSGMPPAPGSAPSVAARPPASPLHAQLPEHGPPVMVHPQTQQAPAPPTAVDASQSWPSAPPGAYVGYGDPSPGPMPESPLGQVVEENGHTLGLALILTGIGTAVGIKFMGGLYGAAAGGLYGGSLVNLIRAARAVTTGTPEGDHEAVVSATYGVVGAGVASYILYQGRKEKRAT